jgi:hypothetical protein
LSADSDRGRRRVTGRAPAGTDERPALRHASISTTLNIYTHVVDASHRKAIEALEGQLFPRVPKLADQPKLDDSTTADSAVA